MKTWMKIILPLLGIAYFIAFLEISLPEVHQTWNDQHETYVVSHQNTDHSTDQSCTLKIAKRVIASIAISPVILPLCMDVFRD